LPIPILEMIPLTLLVLYLLPFMVAAARHHESLMPILAANILLAWTIIGWWGVLWWAWSSEAEPSRAASRRRRDIIRARRDTGGLELIE
jgi:hypothetical protein